MSNTATIDLKAHDTGVGQALDHTRNLVGNFASGVTAVMTTAVAAIKAVEFGKEVFSWGKAFVEAASEAEQNATRLAFAVKSNAGAVGFTTEQFMSLSSEIQRYSKFEDDMAQKAIANALKFKNVRGPIFKEMIKISADYASIEGGDLVSASDRFARALNDPTHGLMRLRMEGVVFTESQKDMIKQFMEEGKVMEAQRIILDQLKARWKDGAEVMGNTAAGQVEKLKNRFGDMSEALGGLIIPFLTMITPLVDKLATALENSIPFVERWAAQLKSSFDALIERAKPTLEWFLDTSITTFAAVTVVIENFGDVVSFTFDAMLLSLIQTWEDLSILLTKSIPAALLWLQEQWKTITLSIATYTMSTVNNMLNNVKSFIGNLKSLLKGGGGDEFRFTALEEGLKTSLAKVPDEVSAIDTFKKRLEDRVGKGTADIFGKIVERSTSIKSFIDGLFKKSSDAVDMTDQASHDFDEFKKDAEIEDKKAGFGVTETEEERRLFGPRAKNIGQFEDIVAVNKRIASAAAGGDPTTRIVKAIQDAQIKDAEKLDRFIEIMKPAGEAQEEAARSLKEMERGVPAVLV